MSGVMFKEKGYAFVKTHYALLTLAFLFAGSIYRLNEYVWSLSDYSQGPIVLLIFGYLFFVKWREIAHERVDISNAVSLIYWMLLIVGIFFYIIGRSQFINFVEILSYCFLIPAVVGLVYGTRSLKKLWFPIFFTIFLIPLPSFFVASVTMPIKIAVSTVTLELLSLFDLPVAQSGVILQIGQYKLFVADACAGMNTLFTLEGLGLFYLNIVKSDSLFRNISLTILIIPISFLANVFRVLAIALITYYFGDEVGQGFLHGFAGIFMFTVALLAIISIDAFFEKLSDKKKKVAYA
jgi:exosortase B